MSSFVDRLLGRPSPGALKAEEAMAKAFRKQERTAKIVEHNVSVAQLHVAMAVDRAERIPTMPPAPMRTPSLIDPSEIEELELV